MGFVTHRRKVCLIFPSEINCKIIIEHESLLLPFNIGRKYVIECSVTNLWYDERFRSWGEN